MRGSKNGRKNNYKSIPLQFSCFLQIWYQFQKLDLVRAVPDEPCLQVLGFPQSSVGKELACNAGDPGSILGLGRSTGEGIGYPPQYSWVSLVAQLVKNLPAMQETWIQSLGWEDPLEEGHGNSLQYSGLENSPDRGPGRLQVHGVAQSRTRLSD